MGESSFIIQNEDSFRQSMDDGVYPYTTTSSDRYVEPESFDYRIFEHLSEVLEEGEDYKIVDVGSSSGEALKGLIDRLESEIGCSFDIAGLDVNREMLERYEGRGETVQAAAQMLPIQENSIDIIVSANLHLKDGFIEEAVEEFNRAMKEDGYAVLSAGYRLEEDNYKGFHSGEIIPE